MSQLPIGWLKIKGLWWISSSPGFFTAKWWTKPSKPAPRVWPKGPRWLEYFLESAECHGILGRSRPEWHIRKPRHGNNLHSSIAERHPAKFKQGFSSSAPSHFFCDPAWNPLKPGPGTVWNLKFQPLTCLKTPEDMWNTVAPAHTAQQWCCELKEFQRQSTKSTTQYHLHPFTLFRVVQRFQREDAIAKDGNKMKQMHKCCHGLSIAKPLIQQIDCATVHPWTVHLVHRPQQLELRKPEAPRPQKSAIDKRGEILRNIEKKMEFAKPAEKWLSGIMGFQSMLQAPAHRHTWKFCAAA